MVNEEFVHQLEDCYDVCRREMAVLESRGINSDTVQGNAVDIKTYILMQDICKVVGDMHKTCMQINDLKNKNSLKSLILRFLPFSCANAKGNESARVLYLP